MVKVGKLAGGLADAGGSTDIEASFDLVIK